MKDNNTVKKVYEVFSGPYFLVFELNTGKCRAGKTPYLGTF